MLSEGDAAPDFELESTAGGTISLAESLTTGPAVVIPFRGYWCSYCAEQLQTFGNLEYDLWRHYDTTILPVASDPVSDLVTMRDRFDLGLQLLSDPDLSVAGSYSDVQDQDTYGEIPVPGTFIIDSDGIVQYAHVAEHVADRTYANRVRSTIKSGFEDRYTPSTFH